LGTGTGLSTSWILDGMGNDAYLISIDNDEKRMEIANRYLGHDTRLLLTLSDGETWIKNNRGMKFDYIFADTWPGKFLLLDEVLDMLNQGGLYILDDMLPQPNWPEGHKEKVNKLVNHLGNRADLILTKQNWATGIIIAAKK
jgi:predicted O-methyltransferase YrrM